MAKRSPPRDRTWRERAKVLAPAILVLIAAFVATYQFVKPAPPSHVVLASGPEDGVYYYFGKTYRELLAKEGIDLTLLPTRGSVENLQLLKDGEADIAFVQGGTGAATDAPNLLSLASLYFEPLWVFVRADGPVTRLKDLRGQRLAIGAEGSGTRAIALKLLGDVGIDPSTTKMEALNDTDGARALHAGEVDAAFLVVSARSTVVRELLKSTDVRLLGIDRAPAFALQHRFLSKLTLPEGAVDLASDLPPADTVLLAPAATLVVREGFHPALSELFLHIAKKVHGGPGLFEEAGEFPSRKFVEFPLSEPARRFFDSGPSFLQRYLPFWAANLIDRLKIMLLPLVTLLYPLAKMIPPTYDWRMRSRINRWYKDLQEIEWRLLSDRSHAHIGRELAELDRIEQSVRELSLPLSYANPLYNLRLHIGLLRTELREALDGARPTEERRDGDARARPRLAREVAEPGSRAAG